MPIRFTQLRSKDPYDYLRRKWEAAPGTDAVAVLERSLDGLHSAEAGLAALPLRGPAAVPDHEERHRAIVSKMLDRALPLIEGEELSEPDSLDVLAEDAVGFPRGTLLLRRTTNCAELVYFVPCTNVVDGVLHRGRAHDEADERVLAQLATAKLRTDGDPGEALDELAPAAEPITMSVIASTILLGIISGAASQIGSQAVGWALSQLGIGDLPAHSQVSYDRLVEALKLQSREDFRREIRARTGAFVRLLDDYNAGARSEEKLRTLYNEIRQLTAWIEQDYAEVDRVHHLAYVQAQYLSIMQEQAEWYRRSDPAKMKSFYEAMTKRAAKELDVLRRVKQAAIDQRMAKIRGLLDRWHPLGEYRVTWFEDVVDARERSWELYETRCTNRDMHTGVCRAWEPTQKGRDTLADVQRRLDRHRAWIREQAQAALRGVDETIARFQQIANMQVPPPPPK